MYMLQGEVVYSKVLVLAGNKTLYIGDYSPSENKSRGSIVLHQARLILDWKGSFHTIAMGQCKGCSLTKAIEKITVKDVEMTIKLSESVVSKLLVLPVKFSNVTTALDYNTLHLASVLDHDVINISGNAVIITQQHGRAGFGYKINVYLSMIPCYTISYNNGEIVGCGNNLHAAFDCAKNIVLNHTVHSPRNYDWAAYCVSKYPDVDAQIPVIELIDLHNFMTNSCNKGINEFCVSHQVNVRSTASMREFLTITKDAYASDVIESIANKYGITI